MDDMSTLIIDLVKMDPGLITPRATHAARIKRDNKASLLLFALLYEMICQIRLPDPAY